MNGLIDFIKIYPYFVIIVSFAVGYFFMPVVVKIARKYNFVVSPNKRTSHKGEIPNVGGINIFVSFLLTVFLFSFDYLSSVQFLLMGLLIILIVGFVDDLISVMVTTKLFGQLFSAFFLIVVADLRITSFHGLLGIYELPETISYLFSFFTFVVIINAINLVDGIDGLASGLGMIYMLFFGIYFQLTRHPDLSLTAYAMFGSLAVFFIYNVFSKRKKIFMGDSGSLLLGYVIIVLVFSFCELNADAKMPQQYHIAAAPAVAISLLIIPLFDTMRVMITRVKKGYSPFKADRNHLHHLILSLGLKHRQVTFILMGVSCLFLFIGLLGRNLQNGLLIFIVLLLCVALMKYLWMLVDRKREETTLKK